MRQSDISVGSTYRVASTGTTVVVMRSLEGELGPVYECLYIAGGRSRGLIYYIERELSGVWERVL